MNREYHKWYSSRLGRDMELLLYGHAGHPIIVFPSSFGKFYQYEDFGMIQVLAGAIDAGHLQIVCVDSVDTESWYNRSIPVHDRALRHNAWEQYLIHEVLPFFNERNWAVGSDLTVTGCSFGAYHAVNFGFKHPDRAKHIVAMSGAYSLDFLLRGGHDIEEYFNSPLSYVPNMHDDWYLSRMRQQQIILATTREDICYESTRQMSQALWDKAVPHWHDVWDHGLHDWPIWREMAIKYFT